MFADFATAIIIGLPVILGIIGYSLSKDFYVFFAFGVIGFMIGGCNFAIKINSEMETCKETSIKIRPQFVYLSDSSEKILKINGEHIKTIPRTSFEFFVAESLIVVDPCDNSISVKAYKND